jgi:hypothetical protein
LGGRPYAGLGSTNRAAVLFAVAIIVVSSQQKTPTAAQASGS